MYRPTACFSAVAVICWENNKLTLCLHHNCHISVTYVGWLGPRSLCSFCLSAHLSRSAEATLQFLHLMFGYFAIRRWCMRLWQLTCTVSSELIAWVEDMWRCLRHPGIFQRRKQRFALEWVYSASGVICHGQIWLCVNYSKNCKDFLKVNSFFFSHRTETWGLKIL